jgi:hypothetical protein
VNSKFILIIKAIALLGIVGMLSFCGGGGGGGGGVPSGILFNGNTNPAAIDDTNVQAVGKSAGESVQNADASMGLPRAASNTTLTPMDQIKNLIFSTINTSNIVTGVDLPGVCNPGSASIANPPTATSGPVEFTIVYTNCAVIGSDITVNGPVLVHLNDVLDPNAGFTFVYTNFTVIDPVNGTTTINLTLVCIDSLSCTFSSDFVGADGDTHRVTNFSISGDASSGFNGTATFLNGTYGDVTITVTNITYGSCGSYPDGGDISFNSSNGSSGTIIFNPGCTVSGTWNDGAGNSGSF